MSVMFSNVTGLEMGWGIICEDDVEWMGFMADGGGGRMCFPQMLFSRLDPRERKRKVWRW